MYQFKNHWPIHDPYKIFNTYLLNTRNSMKSLINLCFVRYPYLLILLCDLGSHRNSNILVTWCEELTHCNPMNCSTPGFPAHHQLPELAQTHVHWVGDAIQPSHPLLSPSPPAPNPSQHQGLFRWVNSSHEVANVLEFQLQHQSFQWTLRTDLV